MSERRDDPDFPIRGYAHGQPLPDLNKIDKSRWKAVLRPLGDFQRRVAVAKMSPRGPDWRDDVTTARVICGELALEGPPTAASARSVGRGETLPAPSARATPRRETVQVNVRLSVDDKRRLERAAGSMGLKPVQLARTFIVNGANRVLYEQRRREAKLRAGERDA